MALRKCRDCRNRVSSRATTCPHCGAQVKRKTSPLAGAIALLVIIAVCVRTGVFNLGDKTLPSVADKQGNSSRTATGQAAAQKAAAQPKARAPKQRATRLPGYEVVFDDSSDTPIKTQVELRITLDKRPSESQLRALLGSLYEKVKKRSGFNFRAHPDAVYIYAFGKKNYHKNSGASWIGMLSLVPDDKEPTISLDSSRLKAQFEDSSIWADAGEVDSHPPRDECPGIAPEVFAHISEFAAKEFAGGNTYGSVLRGIRKWAKTQEPPVEFTSEERKCWHSHVKGMEESSTRLTRFRLTEERRKQIYWELFKIADKAQRGAERKVPNPKTLEDFKRQAGASNKLHARYLKRLLRKHKITDEHRVEISLEGIQKNWPEPSP